MCITIVCFPGCDVIKFEINLIFLTKLFFYMTKKPRQKFKYLKNEKREGEIRWNEKVLFITFKGLFSRQKLFQAWECAFKPLGFHKLAKKKSEPYLNG